MAEPRNKQMKASNWPTVPASPGNVGGISVEINFLWFTLAISTKRAGRLAALMQQIPRRQHDEQKIVKSVVQ